MENGCTEKCGYCSAILMLLGRICLVTIFILSGTGKLLDPEHFITYMASKGFFWVEFFLYTAAAFELVGGLMVLLGIKARWGAILLVIFLIPTTFIFHSYWLAPPAAFEVQRLMFLKNLGIFGGLLYIIATGSGAISIDRLFGSKK